MSEMRKSLNDWGDSGRQAAPLQNRSISAKTAIVVAVLLLALVVGTIMQTQSESDRREVCMGQPTQVEMRESDCGDLYRQLLDD